MDNQEHRQQEEEQEEDKTTREEVQVRCNEEQSMKESQDAESSPLRATSPSRESRRSCTCLSICVSSFSQKWPRTFHILIRVIIPLFGLIGVSFFCGYFLVRLESGTEMANNDASLAATFNASLLASSIAYGKYVPDGCLADWNVNDPEYNATGLLDFLLDCRKDLVLELSDESQEDVTFDWITCDDGGHTPYVDQYEHVLYTWTEDYFRLVEMYVSDENLTFWEASDLSLQESTGHRDCANHAAAGALFWFTVMTTIGYGNMAPSTTGGRTLVYTLGFFSVILFGSIIGWAAQICIVIFEDFCIRRNLKWLIKGVVAPLFWLAVLALWLLVLAGLSINYDRIVGGPGQNLADAYWFAYISITTIGLGDIYFKQETFTGGDMVVISLVFLLGFCLMACFLVKLSEWLSDVVTVKGQPLEEVLHQWGGKPLRIKYT